MTFQAKGNRIYNQGTTSSIAIRATEAEASDKNEEPKIRRKGKKPLKKTFEKPSGKPTPFPSKRALLEVA